MPRFHFTPQFYSEIPCDVQLVDVVCAEFGLKLRNSSEIVARRPFPNKRYHVVCRKAGQKAMIGLLVEHDQIPSEFTVVTRWAVDAGEVLTHTVRYMLLDTEFDFATDQMTLWSGTPDYPSRRPDIPQYGFPARTQPRMGLLSNDGREGIIEDVLGPVGLLSKRHETFYIPTISPGRFETSPRSERLPGLGDAFITRHQASIQIPKERFA